MNNLKYVLIKFDLIYTPRDMYAAVVVNPLKKLLWKGKLLRQMCIVSFSAKSHYTWKSNIEKLDLSVFTYFLMALLYPNLLTLTYFPDCFRFHQLCPYFYF